MKIETFFVWVFTLLLAFYAGSVGGANLVARVRCEAAGYITGKYVSDVQEIVCETDVVLEFKE